MAGAKPRCRLGWLLLLTHACASDTATARYPLSEIEPPPYVDVELCAELRRGGPDDAQAVAMCESCCGDGGFTHHSHALADRCVCATLPERPSDAEVCTPSEDQASCQHCCAAEGFGAGAIVDDACTCSGILDTESCVELDAEPEPELSCQVCCVEQGYLSLTFNVSNGAISCACRG